MRATLLLIALFTATVGWGQYSFDSSGTSLTVREKTPAGSRSLTVFKSFVEGVGIRNQVAYQPTADAFGEEPETLNLKFATEQDVIKKMLDAALSHRKVHLSRFALNPLPYSDLCAKLVDAFSASTEWNEYLRKNPNLKRTLTLDDGNEITEAHFDTSVAASVLAGSHYADDVRKLFAPYGYDVVICTFPEEHQEMLSTDKLMLLGKSPSLQVPVPSFYFLLDKSKK